jgi:ABC-type branched-subunit amino acid transport system substrate-binding protein
MTRSTRRGRKPLALVVAVVTIASGALLVSGGTAVSQTTKCSGTTLKLMTIAPDEVSGPVQSAPEIASGARAAEKAVNASCEAGQPIKVITCDDHNTPDGDTACARQATEEGVVSVTSYATYSSLIQPIITAAGIPDVGGVLTDPAAQGVSPMSFSAVPSPALLFGFTYLDVSLGYKKLAALYLDVPTVSALLGILPGLADSAGFDLVAKVPVPPTQVDMSTYVAQALDANANGIIPVLNGIQSVAVPKALVQQGKSLTDFAITSSGIGIRPTELKSIGSAANGFLLGNTFASVNDTKNKGIKAYFKELKAAKEPKKTASELGVMGWSAVHYISGFLKEATTKDAAGLVQVLNTKGIVNRPEIAPTDFTKHAFTSDQNAVLSSLRIFQNEYYPSRYVNGKQVKLAPGDGFTPMLEPVKVKKTKSS